MLRCHGSHSGVGLVPWEHGRISCVCMSVPDTFPSYFMFFKAKQLSSCYSVEKQTLSNQMSESDTEICRSVWACRVWNSISAYQHMVHFSLIQMGSNLDDSDDILIRSISHFGFYWEQCWVKIELELLYNKIDLKSTINSKYLAYQKPTGNNAQLVLIFVSSIMKKQLQITSWSEQIQVLNTDHVLLYCLAIPSWASWIEQSNFNSWLTWS